MTPAIHRRDDGGQTQIAELAPQHEDGCNQQDRRHEAHGDACKPRERFRRSRQSLSKLDFDGPWRFFGRSVGLWHAGGVLVESGLRVTSRSIARLAAITKARLEPKRKAPVLRGEQSNLKETSMARGVRRDRDEDRRDGRSDPQDREDFGQADYSRDYGYDPDARAGYRADERMSQREDDYGQADYSRDWAYDPERGRPYRRHSEDDRERRDWEARHDERRGGRYRAEREDEERREPRSWSEREDEQRKARRRGPSDRVLWAVIVERLEDERGLDLRDVDVRVEGAEVTLNGTVRRKTDKRRIEDLADVEGVRHVQNNLRVRDRSHWTFL